jgi:transposase
MKTCGNKSLKEKFLLNVLDKDMTSLNRREKEKLVVDLYENGSSYHEIAKEARVSLRDIKGILDRANGVQSLSKSSQAYRMFSEGKSPIAVAIALDMREHDVTQLYRESWTLKQLYDLNSIYLETKGDLGSFVTLYKLSKAAGLNADHVIRILKLADYDLPSLEGRYYNLKSEVKSLEEKKESLIRIIQDYDNQVTALGKSFDSYCRLCQEEEGKLTDLQRKRLQAESLASHFENNNEGYVNIRNVVEHKVYSTLSNVTLLLKLAVSSVVHSIRNSPEQYISLIQDNFSSARYNTSSHPFYTEDYLTQHFETILMNDATKMYSNLAKNLTDEILSTYDIGSSSQSSLPLTLSSDQD